MTAYYPAVFKVAFAGSMRVCEATYFPGDDSNYA